MIKPCVVLDGKVINVGEWDDLDGTNPMPEGAVVEEREFEYSEEYGWRESGYTEPLTEEKQRLLDLEMAVATILGGGM